MRKKPEQLPEASPKAIDKTIKLTKESPEMVREVIDHLFSFVHNSMRNGVESVQIEFFGKFIRRKVRKQKSNAELI
jgi:nucleoid DNA-binding protein